MGGKHCYKKVFRMPKKIVYLGLIVVLVLFLSLFLIDRKKTKTFYYDTGEVFSKIEMVNGLQQGTSTNYFKNGDIHFIEKMNKGKNDGKYLSCYKNGMTECFGFFINGKFDREYFCFERNGGVKYCGVNDEGKYIGDCSKKFVKQALEKYSSCEYTLNNWFYKDEGSK